MHNAQGLVERPPGESWVLLLNSPLYLSLATAEAWPMLLGTGVHRVQASCVKKDSLVENKCVLLNSFLHH